MLTQVKQFAATAIVTNEKVAPPETHIHLKECL